MMECFSPETIDHLKYYVYTYADPTNHEIFYIGKGTGNRIFAHEKMLPRIVMKVIKLNALTN